MSKPARPHPYLFGNGRWCSCCFPEGAPDVTFWRERVRRGCNECAGAGRILFTAEEILIATLTERRACEARAA